jgi:hypothetical protein
VSVEIGVEKRHNKAVLIGARHPVGVAIHTHFLKEEIYPIWTEKNVGGFG